MINVNEKMGRGIGFSGQRVEQAVKQLNNPCPLRPGVFLI